MAFSRRALGLGFAALGLVCLAAVVTLVSDLPEDVSLIYEGVPLKAYNDYASLHMFEGKMDHMQKVRSQRVVFHRSLSSCDESLKSVTLHARRFRRRYRRRRRF
jgi:hypothetical protein